MDAENGIQSKPRSGPLTGASYHLRTFQVSLNLLCHILIGIIVGVILVFVFRLPKPLGDTPKHIILCVLGYQLLMAQAILSMSPFNTWSTHLKLVDKKRAHWILQILGSSLAIAGSCVKIIDKENDPNATHWATPHGISGLVALVFTVASLISGLTSLYAYEVRKCLPSKLPKIAHVCFGVVAFAAANITLCHGFEKGLFRGWLVEENSDPIVNTLITFVALLTSIIIVAPLITFYQKVKTN